LRYLLWTKNERMIKIEYPDKKPAIKKENGKEYIFCLIRKRWFIITPEEWVRQNFLLYLVEVLKYPASLIAVEKQLQLSDIKKRFDIVVYKDSLPFMIIECKEMNVPLSENTMLQVLNYNSGIQADYMCITNGSYSVLYKKVNGSFIEDSEMPAFI
jgi:hypothetical protein